MIELQCIGIIFSTMGSILAITSLWQSYSKKMLNQLIKKSEYRDYLFKSKIDYLDKIMGKNKFDRTDVEEIRKFDEKLKEYENLSEEFLKKYVIHKIIDRYFPITGLFLIFIGCIFQLIGLII